MLFGSGPFLKFMMVALICVLVVPPRRRWIALLVLSLAYYASFRAVGLIAILLAAAAIAWFTAIRVAAGGGTRAQARWLWIGVSALLAVMVAARAVTAGIFGAGLPAALRLGSTIGVSYFTLQAVGYVADVYLGKLEPERGLGRFVLFLSFFPRVAQGPIERGRALLPQLTEVNVPEYPALRAAAVLFAWGLFKKAVLADRLAPLVDPVYAEPSSYGGLVALLSTYAYAFQLYFDFSGYTDMARGAAGLLGIELSENFRAPYLATSVSEFWRRWHITFSRWLLDYVFTPLQVRWRRLRRWGTALALFVTFALSGLWHGATACFLIWGLLHGVYLAVGALRPARRSTRSRPWATAVRVVVTFHLVAFAWIFFRAPRLGIAADLLASVSRPTAGLARYVAGVGVQYAAVTALACAAYATVAALRRRPGFAALERRPLARWAGYVALAAALFVLGQSSAGYLYFQF